MRKLFEDGPRSSPTTEVVKQLEDYGYKAATVMSWTAEHAHTVLAAVKKEQGIALRRAAERAKGEGLKPEKAPPRGLPVPVLRLEAARYLSQRMSADDLCQAVMYSTCFLDDSEIKALADDLAAKFRANNGFCPAHPGLVEDPSGGDRGEPEIE